MSRHVPSVVPSGSVATLGGRPYHWNDYPGPGTTVLLMSGCGLASDHWAAMVGLMPQTHVVTYDRPGMKGTPWPRRLPTLAEEVAGLIDLLTVVGAPAILVAHSMASLHAEALARRRPELVAGIVMVDGSAEWQANPPRRTRGFAPLGVRALTSVKPFHLLGSLVHRIGASVQSFQHSGHDWDDRYAHLYRDPDAVAMGSAESEAYWQQAWDLLAVRAAYPLPRCPIVVLTASHSHNRLDRANQHRYARLLGAQQLVVERSRHLMMVDRPDAIAVAVSWIRQKTDVDGASD